MSRDTSPADPSARAAYHHGNLTEALLATAVALIEEKGVEALSVREVAKRAGVSPAAPFRHFRSRNALITAVAEQAMGRLTDSVRTEMQATGDADPISALRGIGRAYLRWAHANPTHFQVISSRSLVDFHNSPRLVAENEAIRQAMAELVHRARQSGQLREGLDAEDLMLALRAFVYGVARMWIDGHFREWKVDRPPAEAMEGALDLFVSLLRGPRDGSGEGQGALPPEPQPAPGPG